MSRKSEDDSKAKDPAAQSEPYVRPDGEPPLPPPSAAVIDPMPPGTPKPVQRGNPERKLTFRAWLWVQHKDNTEFAPLARLVLGGGPEGIWMGKYLKADYVRGEIEMFYASGRVGVTYMHVDLARRGTDRYREDALTVAKMIEEHVEAEKTSTKQIWGAVHEAGEEITKLPGPDNDGNAVGKKTGATFTRYAEDGTELRADAEYADDNGAAPLDVVLPGTRMQHTKRYWQSGDPLTPMVNCTYVAASGQQCLRLSVAGSVRCDIHGGTLLDAEEVRRYVRAGRDRLMMASAAAVDTIIDLMQNSVNDVVRLKAAEVVLDRAGVRADEADAGPGQTAQSPADELKERMQRLNVVKGEVTRVEDDNTKRVDQVDGHTEGRPPAHGNPVPVPPPLSVAPLNPLHVRNEERDNPVPDAATSTSPSTSTSTSHPTSHTADVPPEFRENPPGFPEPDYDDLGRIAGTREGPNHWTDRLEARLQHEHPELTPEDRERMVLDARDRSEMNRWRYREVDLRIDALLADLISERPDLADGYRLGERATDTEGPGAPARHRKTPAAERELMDFVDSARARLTPALREEWYAAHPEAAARRIPRSHRDIVLEIEKEQAPDGPDGSWEADDIDVIRGHARAEVVYDISSMKAKD
jgi:hypothetical protein